MIKHFLDKKKFKKIVRQHPFIFFAHNLHTCTGVVLTDVIIALEKYGIITRAACVCPICLHVLVVCAEESLLGRPSLWYGALPLPWGSHILESLVHFGVDG